MYRFRKRFHAWLAIAAMLMAALAPAVSRATATVGEGLLIDVCSAGGTHQIQILAGEAERYLDSILAGGEESDDSSGSSLSSCPYCASHTLGVGLPPLASAARLLTQGVSDALPRLFLIAPRPLFAWSPSSPRAPPFLV